MTSSDIEGGHRSQEMGPSGWTGWVAFAAFMMMLLGAFHAFQGLLALFNDEYYLVTSNGLAVHVDYTIWGWVHIVLGVFVALAGYALFAGRLWGRVVAVLVALVSALVNAAFISATPWWSTIMIVINILIIWAVTVHGREMKSV